MNDSEALLEGVPQGAKLSGARKVVIPPRTWVTLGMDGIEIYLDADQGARFLVRVVTAPPSAPTA